MMLERDSRLQNLEQLADMHRNGRRHDHGHKENYRQVQSPNVQHMNQHRHSLSSSTANVPIIIMIEAVHVCVSLR